MSHSKKIALATIAMVFATGSTLSAFADDVTTTAVDTNVTTTVDVAPVMAPPPTVTTNAGVSVRNKKSIDFSQLVAPLAIREDAIATAWQNEYAAISTAIQARKTALDAAYSSSTDPKTVKAAVAKAHNDYRDAVKTARQTSLAARKAAWNAYRDAVKALKIQAAASVEAGSASSTDTH